MDMVAILINGAEPYEKSVHILNKRSSVKSGENWSSGFRERDV